MQVNINFVARPHRAMTWLRHASRGLIITSLALLAYPFWGLTAYQFRLLGTDLPPHHATPPADTRAAAATIAEPPDRSQISATPPPPVDRRPQQNLVVIPKIGVTIDIVEGLDGKSALRQGAWRLPGTSTPERGGNTVVAAHRYLFRPPSSRTFYNLDKLTTGDIINVAWQGQVYVYRVRDVRVVQPYQVEILADTADTVITLFTCAPLFTSKQRLVVVAEKI